MLSCCRRLMWLDVSRCNSISDDVVDSAGAAMALTTLYLRGNGQLTDKVLDLLLSAGGARKLEELDWAGCHGVTARCVARLQASRPSLAITAPEAGDGGGDDGSSINSDGSIAADGVPQLAVDSDDDAAV